MKVILNTDIPNLGEEGDVLEVKPGYVRNYLLPNKFVSLYNRTNLSILESRRSAIEKKKDERRKAALSDKEKLDSMLLTFSMPAGENGKLFGAVTAQMIVDEIEKQEIMVERKKVEIPGHTIKAVGDYKIGIRLYNDASAELKIRIVPEQTKEESKAADDSRRKHEHAKTVTAVESQPVETSEDRPAEVGVEATAVQDSDDGKGNDPVAFVDDGVETAEDVAEQEATAAETPAAATPAADETVATVEDTEHDPEE